MWPNKHTETKKIPMEEDTHKRQEPLEILAGIADQFTLLTLNRITTDINIKLNQEDYTYLVREIENITKIGGPPDSKTFSLDIDDVNFIFTRD
jgi:hypothetical protein